LEYATRKGRIMAYSARTDLALELREIYFETASDAAEAEGVEAEEENKLGIKVTRVKITNKKGEKTLGKPSGTYITMEFGAKTDFEQESYENACKVCAEELSSLKKNWQGGTVLVLGLGNRNITADALGPKTVDSVLVTRHLLEYMPEEIDSRLKPVCAVAPGVLGITGVETGEIVKGICERIKPSLIIAVDALCSRRMERVNNTIQLTDTGITPGAGIGNRRMSIDEKTLGIPVIAVGVPTVVDAATIAGDTIDRIIQSLKDNAKESIPLYKILNIVAGEDKEAIINEVLKPDCLGYIVTPKEVDTAVEKISEIIANGINIALHEGITINDINRYR
jgi:spore protease